jgi:hypothetical protein
MDPSKLSLAQGQYVRIVGTGWRDEDHNEYSMFGLKNSSPVTEANDCFRQYFSQHTNSWREIHSADIIETSSPQQDRPRHTLVAYAACEGGTPDYMVDYQDLSSLPYGQGRPDSGQYISDITSWMLGDTGMVSASSVTGVGTIGTTVTLGVGAGGRPGALTVFYDVTWGSCPSGLVGCGTKCVSLATTSNCGACGNACGAGATCTNGTCVAPLSCPAGQAICGNACAVLSKDRNNCGACGRVCSPTEFCQFGECACSPTKTCPARTSWDTSTCSCVCTLC